MHLEPWDSRPNGLQFLRMESSVEFAVHLLKPANGEVCKFAAPRFSPNNSASGMKLNLRFHAFHKRLIPDVLRFSHVEAIA